MDGHAFTLAGERLLALPSGALWWPARRLLAVADLHLGKAGRLARAGGPLLPPFEGRETLARLAAAIDAAAPAEVVCLGDSFDDLAAADALPADEGATLARLMAGRRWVWITGNHDPGPLALGGSHTGDLRAGALTFRHIATPGAEGEVSGHYHPKVRVPGTGGPARPAFLIDAARAILPAFGAYTGGMHADRPPLATLMRPGAVAVLTGPRALAFPLAPHPRPAPVPPETP